MHSKKNRFFTEPPKKVPEMSKSAQMRPKSQKKDKKIYETFKGYSPGHKLETFKYETFFKFRRAEKGFVGKMRNL